ncbi:hypothetical protein IGI04_002132 [Brassica rapa subsp. trilocularis]|uniref:Uncharacterized protein n=1 Tax=Brassica rapa subsp. trilocularis TaxID=1813537 RepID=A0ABQ7NWV7_BRACM|nr:hypothetical protein IGI04_002132 [Brassica rapa subsp. trilocularis]
MVCTDSSLITPQYEINFVRHEAIGSLKTSVDDVTLYFQNHPEFERLAMLQNVTPKPKFLSLATVKSTIIGVKDATRLEITGDQPSWLPRVGRRAAPTSRVRVRLPASLTPSRDVATSSSSCVRVWLSASLDPELRRRDYFLFVRAGLAPCVSRRRVETSTLPPLRGQPRVLHLHRNTRHRRHQQVAAVASDRAVTACPEAPACFSFAATSPEPAIAVCARGDYNFRLRCHWLMTSLSPRRGRALPRHGKLSVVLSDSSRSLLL